MVIRANFDEQGYIVRREYANFSLPARMIRQEDFDEQHRLAVVKELYAPRGDNAPDRIKTKEKQLNGKKYSGLKKAGTKYNSGKTALALLNFMMKKIIC